MIRDDAVLTINARTEAEAGRAALRLVARRIAGLILIGSPRDQALIRQIAARVATVCVGRNLSRIGVSSVLTDDLMRARLAAPCLVGEGHRRIAHISGSSGAGAIRREWACRETMEAAELPPIVHAGYDVIDAGLDGVHHLMAMPQRPTATCAASDLSAIGAMKRLASLGYSVPGDVSIIGFDDIPLARSPTSSLSVIRQPTNDMVARAIDILLRRCQECHPPGGACRAQGRQRPRRVTVWFSSSRAASCHLCLRRPAAASGAR